MYQKLMLQFRTKLLYLTTEELIDKLIYNNTFMQTLIKEELLKRDLSNLDINDEKINLVIDKLSIEEIWFLANLNINNHFIEIVTIKLNKILDYYQKKNFEDFLKKKNEDSKKLIKIK